MANIYSAGADPFEALSRAVKPCKLPDDGLLCIPIGLLRAVLASRTAIDAEGGDAPPPSGTHP